MDLVNQDKFKNWLIIALFAMNIFTLAIIWTQITGNKESEKIRQNPPQSESAGIVNKALELDDAQADKFNKIRASQREKAKKLNDSLDILKKEMADELFKSSPDSIMANLKAKKIGELQYKLEYSRFSNFKNLLAISTKEQKEKLKPVIIDLFGRRPALDKPGVKTDQKKNMQNEPPPDPETANKNKGAQGQPPSIDDRIVRYSERLNLSQDQIQKVKEILQSTRQRGELLRKKQNPDKDFVESEKVKIRKDEDAAIMKILNEEQKKEFSRMVDNRSRQK
jgi:Spy/CpxP family protein refolding chaperone